jgi:hypothetical protein
MFDWVKSFGKKSPLESKAVDKEIEISALIIAETIRQ